MIYQFKIQIKGITKPPVWRKIIMPSTFTFGQFHLAIQIAFGWEMEHLYFFSPKGYQSEPIIESHEYDDELLNEHSIDADKIKLNKIFISEKQTYVYLYDFGDDWIHTITLEKILPDVILFPKILAGKGQCPPEDCGGPWGYEDLKTILADPHHEEYESYADWLGLEKGEKWDAEEFDIDEKNNIMLSVFANK
ncbi:MAG: plasmid pRiA4b ORF-3 family protein [Paludibacter sp.]|nr:plasmid pRiA4b ORF-3 family protein [Paludibacter sp.]